MKQKKTILLCCMTAALLVLSGMVVMLCMGCDTDTTPDGPNGDTTAGDQITEEIPTEGESLPSTVAPETEENSTPSPETTESEPEIPSEPVTEEPETTFEETAAEEPTPDVELPTFEAYYAMSSTEQEAFYLSFANPADFFAWYNAARDQYLEENPGVDLGPGGAFPIP